MQSHPDIVQLFPMSNNLVLQRVGDVFGTELFGNATGYFLFYDCVDMGCNLVLEVEDDLVLDDVSQENCFGLRVQIGVMVWWNKVPLISSICSSCRSSLAIICL